MQITPLKAATFSLALLTASAAAFADVGEDRATTMKGVGKAMKSLAEIAKGAPYDAATVSTSAASLQESFVKFGTLFPAGSEAASKASSPDIWANRADFDTLRINAEAAAVKLGKTDEAGFKAAFGELAGTCKACHTKYRIAD